MSFLDKLKKIDPGIFNPSNYVKLPYRYVPPCPCCGDSTTGFYIKSVSPKQDFMTQRESIKNAEITKLAAEIPENNCFCLNCGFEWHSRVKTVWITQTEMNGERIARSSEAILKEYFSTEDEKKSDRKKKTLKNAFSGIADAFSVIPSGKTKKSGAEDASNTDYENMKEDPDEELALSDRRL